jgi:flagellar motor switch protein FliM
MRKVLSQDEIDALFNAAQPGQKGEPTAKKHVERCDLAKAKTLSAEQIRVVNTLHESSIGGASLRAGQGYSCTITSST